MNTLLSVRRWWWRSFFVVAGLLSSQVSRAQLGSPLRRVLRADTTVFGRILRQPDRYRVQILYTRINRDAQNRPHFRTYGYHVRPHEYFYPASTVKLPAAVLALQKLGQLRPQVPGLTPDSPLRIDSAFAGQSNVRRDTSAANGRASLAQYIRKVLLVSDNDAFNRLYEFVGQGPLNEELHRRGYSSARIIHRLSVGDQEPGSRHTNPLTFYADTALQRPLYLQPAAFNEKPFPTVRRDNLLVGKAYMQGDKRVDGSENTVRVNKPMDFATKNFISLTDLQGVLRAVLFPEAVPAKQRFQLGEEDYAFLRCYLSMLPRESAHPRYKVKEFPDNYVKFLLAGGPAGPLPMGVRIFNKIGQAYGFLIDNAYIVDLDRNVEFMLSAVIYANSDEVLNDDHYDYDTIGFPFLRDLGRTVYQYELQRPRRHKPDLSRFRLRYTE
ncbi:serine hydrolase [Hymenobacter crusticola]|uniref:Beta-lactamase class A catalytic domain-containing protein n=1 Tax=Hymenobacter crusticola TaxID=1770526 RepID=A0A243W9M7_9BACT|nr:serine hydrolase [Hymenobacter crusticola]OUJ71942.1 hypothetical protein BXP70_20180 [Hymenobacter crusticola]